MNTDLLFALLRNGLHEDRAPEMIPELTVDQWNVLLAEAHRQTVVGVLYHGISRLGEAYPLPSDILFPLVADVNRIEQENRKKEQVAWKEFQDIKAAGFHPVVMKGPAIARLYPKPALRESGDIDLYLPEAEFLQFREQLGTETAVPMPDGSLHYYRNGIDFDLHPGYYDLHVSPALLPKVPSPEAMLLMLSSHIFKHAAGPGVGLRQLCDMAVAYEKLAFEPAALLEVYDKAGMLKWNTLLYAFLRKYLGLKDIFGDALTAIDPEPLLRIVMEGGNFGHFSASRKEALSAGRGKRKFDTALRYLKRFPFSLRYAPRETLSYLGDLAKGNFRK